MKSNLDRFLLFVFITLQRLPLLFTDEYLIYASSFIVLLPFWIYFLLKWFPIIKKGSISNAIDPVIAILFMLLLILIFTSLIRGYFYESFSIIYLVRHSIWWGTVTFFGCTLFLLQRDKDEIKKLREFIFYGLIFYVVINVLFQLIGVVSPREIVVWNTLGQAKMLSLVGVEIDRVAFAMSTGPVPFGIISGAVILFGVQLFLDNYKKYISLIIILIGVYALLLTDSRSSLFWVLISLFLYFVFNRISFKMIRVVPFISLLLPFFLIWGATIFADTNISKELARKAGYENIITLSERTIVWDYITNELMDFDPIYFVGYGARGQVASGLGRSYSSIFEDSYAFNVGEKTAHNFALQQIIDVGYLGLIIYLLHLYQIIKKCERNNQNIDRKLSLIFIIYITLSGVSNVVPTIYNNELFTCLLFLISSYLVKERKYCN